MPTPTDDQVLLTAEALNPAAAMAFVNSPQAGAIDLFLGTTREEIHPEHGPLVALDYAAYPEMAERHLRQLVAETRARWPICRTALHHRVGQCPVGAISVVIAVSSPHRADAFDACRHLINQLKQSAPIWKKDLYRDHTHWHHDPAESP